MEIHASPKANTALSRAQFVCVGCKARKKACDKVLPACGYCSKRSFNCSYDDSPLPNSVRNQVSPDTTQATQRTKHYLSPSQPPLWSSSSIDMQAEAHNVQQQVARLVSSTGYTPDELSSNYFHGMHLWLPFISRDDFHRKLAMLEPSADFAVLLLAMCLIGLPYGPEALVTRDQRKTMYMRAKRILAQVQCEAATCDVIRATTLMALFEYRHRSAEQAIVTLSVAIRMAYNVRLDVVGRLERESDGVAAEDEAQQENNIWWALVICERLFVLETRSPHQPLATTISTLRPLPIESDTLSHSYSARTSSTPLTPADTPASTPPHPTPAIFPRPPPFTTTSGLTRTAQAIMLLDRVLAFTSASSSASTTNPYKPPPLRLATLVRLDADLRTHLSLVLTQCRGFAHVSFCGPVATTLRAMLALHCWVVETYSRPSSPVTPCSNGGRASVTPDYGHDEAEDADGGYYTPCHTAQGVIADSEATLRTVAHIWRDIAVTHRIGTGAAEMDALPPTSVYSLEILVERMRKGRLEGKSEMDDEDEGKVLWELEAFLERWKGRYERLVDG